MTNANIFYKLNSLIQSIKTHHCEKNITCPHISLRHAIYSTFFKQVVVLDGYTNVYVHGKNAGVKEQIHSINLLHMKKEY